MDIGKAMDKECQEALNAPKIVLPPDDPFVQSSMLYWFPKIRKLPIPQIQTEIVEIPSSDLTGMLDNKSLSMTQVANLHKAIKKIGKFPMFVRNDHSSAKHEWENTCFLQSEDNFLQHIFNIVEYTAMCMMGPATYGAIVFREFLPLETGFTAFDGKMPINKEIRCFINDHKVEALYHYWVKHAITSWSEHGDLDDMFGVSDSASDSIKASFEKKKQAYLDSKRLDPDWESKFEKLRAISKDDLKEIMRQLDIIMPEFDGSWSVDFAKTIHGAWYMTDMARGELSFRSDEKEIEF